MTDDADLIFDGEVIDPDDQRQVNAVRWLLMARVYEIALRNPNCFAAGVVEDGTCRAGAYFIPDRPPIFMYVGLTDGFVIWTELPVRTAIALSRLTWRPGNGQPELGAIERLARTIDPYLFTIYDPPTAIDYLAALVAE